MSFIDYQAAVRGKHRGFAPVLRRAAYGNIGHQQMVIHDDDIRFRCLASRLEDETRAEVRTAKARAQISFGGDLVPQFRARRGGKIGDRTVGRVLRPPGDRVELVLRVGLEERRRAIARLLEPEQADVIAPPFQQRKAHLLIPEDALEKGQIFRHELLLERNRRGGDDGAFSVERRPSKRRHQVCERFPHAGARLEQSDAAKGVESRNRPRHLALALAIFVRQVMAGNGASGREHRIHVVPFQRLARGRPRNLDDDIDARRFVVDDGEANPIVVQLRGDLEIRIRRLEESRRMVMDEQLALAREPRKREHLARIAACDDACRLHHAVVVDRADETHFASARKTNRRAHRSGRLLRHARSLAARRCPLPLARCPVAALCPHPGSHVLSGFFFAAGKRTLLRMSL
jgi:hypothetical protein